MTAEVQHPDLLNPWQTYRQARQLLKHTSRASQPDWYKEAVDIERQWHVWYDGSEVVSAIFNQKTGQWHDGPGLPLPSEQDESGRSEYSMDERRVLHETLNGILNDRNLGGKAKALGFIIHVANEFAIADIAPEFAIDEDFDEVNELLSVSPGETMGDLTIEDEGDARRLLPYWGVHEGERKSTAVVVSRMLQVVCDEATEYGEACNIPIIAAGISAPLSALLLAPLFLDPTEQGSEGHIFIFNYRKFTSLAVIDSMGDLILCRSLPHRSGQDYASGLGDTLVKTAALVNLSDPHVHIVPMSSINIDPLVKEMSTYFASHTPMNIGFVDLGEVEWLQGIPGGRAEMAIANRPGLEQVFESVRIAQSKSFVGLRSQWGIQNFFGPTAEEKSASPSQKDLKMLKGFGLLRAFLILALIGLIGWTGFDGVRTLASKSWRLSDEESKMSSEKLAALQKENMALQHWENLMEKRSEGWLVMETMLDLFPGPDSGMVVTGADYSISGVAPGRKKTRTIAFNRVWTIEGYAKADKVTELGQLGSTSFIQKKFEALAESTGADSLKPNEETRFIMATMQQRQGRMPASQRFPADVANEYTNFFQLKIQQDFSTEDELALNVRVPGAEGAQ